MRHLKYQMLWILISVTVETVLYLISDVSISAPEGIFIAMPPRIWELIAGVFMMIIFVVLKLSMPLLTTSLPGNSMVAEVNSSLNIWTIVTCVWVLVAGAGNVMLMIRRLHDLGKSGWFVLIAFVPVLGLIFSIVLFCMPGQVGQNRFGEEPL